MLPVLKISKLQSKSNKKMNLEDPEKVFSCTKKHMQMHTCTDPSRKYFIFSLLLFVALKKGNAMAALCKVANGSVPVMCEMCPVAALCFGCVVGQGG